MGYNKIVYDGTTLIDLTSDTLASASSLASGVTAHDRTGTQITGTLTFSTITVSASSPSGGSDGDVWIQTSS